MNGYFENAKKALAQNPTEGQVEKSVVFPILKELGYHDENIFSKVPIRVKHGSKEYETLEADIIAKNDKLPTLVIEAKSPKRGLILPDDYNQGMSYCYSPDVNTRFLFLTSGFSNRLYEANKLLFEYDLKTIFEKIDYFKKLLLNEVLFPEKEPTETDIENFFTYSHNRMYAEDAIKPAEAIHILTKLFLIKTNEERGRTLYNLRSILDYKKDYEKAKTKKEKEKIEDQIYLYLSDCLKIVDTDLLFPEERTISRNLSVTTLFDIIEKLSDYTLDVIPVEKKGSAFDSFLNKTLKGKELGQFFTHRNIVKFGVDMSDLKLSDKILDLACGTGGFIETSFIELSKKVKNLFSSDSEEYIKKIAQLQEKQIFGIEKDGNVASLAKLSMSMNGDGHTTIFKGNGLILTNEFIKENSLNVILTNPPFGSKSVVQIKDPNILSIFNLGKQYKFNEMAKKYFSTGKLQDGQDIGVLFLERSIKLLGANQFLGIILHDGIFSNSSYKYIRQYIRENCRIKAIIKLSSETFKPYSDGGGTETSFLFCEKGSERIQDECFFAVADHVGYKYKRNKIIPDDNDLPELLHAYKNKKNYKESKWIKLSSIPIYERIDSQYHCKQIEFKNAKYAPLKEFLLNNKIFNGFPYQSKYFGKGDFPLVKIRQLNNSLLNINDLGTIPKEYYMTCKNASLKEGDILLAMDGKKEFRASYIDKELLEVAINQRIAIIRVDSKKISPAYIFFVLISNLGQRQLMKSKTQTATVAHLSNGLIESVKIPIIKKTQINKIDKDFNNYLISFRKTQNVFNSLTNSL
jgi:type I restriction enzyme M protein